MCIDAPYTQGRARPGRRRGGQISNQSQAQQGQQGAQQAQQASAAQQQPSTLAPIDLSDLGTVALAPSFSGIPGFGGWARGGLIAPGKSTHTFLFLCNDVRLSYLLPLH
jgi:hypothetical protein